MLTDSPAPTTSTLTIPQDVITGLALVGKIVTVRDWTGWTGQYKVYSVEGPTWYAFDRDGETVVDLDMTPASWITSPVVTVIPSGSKIGDGVSEVVKITDVRRGVCLNKSWI